MEPDLKLIRASVAVDRAAEGLTALTEIGRRGKRLTIADHAQILHELRFTTNSFYQPAGLLAQARSIILLRQTHYAGKPGAGPRLTTGLRVLLDLVRQADTEAKKSDLEPACLALREDLRSLEKLQSPAAEPSKKRGMTAATRIARTNEAIDNFTAQAGIGDRPITDIQTVVGAAADFLAVAKTVCLQEAYLVDYAYEAARIGRRAAHVSEPLTSAGQALQAARSRLSEAASLARELAPLEG